MLDASLKAGPTEPPAWTAPAKRSKSAKPPFLRLQLCAIM